MDQCWSASTDSAFKSWLKPLAVLAGTLSEELDRDDWTAGPEYSLIVCHLSAVLPIPLHQSVMRKMHLSVLAVMCSFRMSPARHAHLLMLDCPFTSQAMMQLQVETAAAVLNIPVRSKCRML